MTALKLKNCLDFKTDELRSGCMQIEEKAESTAISKFQVCCPLYTEGNKHTQKADTRNLQFPVPAFFFRQSLSRLLLQKEIFAIRSKASFKTSTSTVHAARKYPSPQAPKALPGSISTCASCKILAAASSEVSPVSFILINK